MSLRLGLPLILATFALGSLGCNPKGTCTYGDPGGVGGALCDLKASKKSCASVSGSFQEETPAQGLLRCKTEGYDFAPGGGKDLLVKRTKR
jgi:hypothetical protein